MTTIVGGVVEGSPSTTDQTPWELATFTKADVTLPADATAWTTANSPLTAFTVTGLVMLRCFAVVTTSFTSTGSTGTFKLGVPGLITLFVTTYTANGTLLQEGNVLGANAAAALDGTALQNTGAFVLAKDTTVIVSIETNNMTAGGMTIYCQWIALSDGATVA